MSNLDFPNNPNNGDLFPDPPRTGVPVWRFDGIRWRIVERASGDFIDAPVNGKTYGRKDGDWNQVVPITGGEIAGSLAIASHLTVQGDVGTAGHLGVHATASFGGSVNFDSTASVIFENGSINLQHHPGVDSNNIFGRSGIVQRWAISPGDAVPEGGSNTGSNFGIFRANDSGGFVDAPLYINRGTGAVTLGSIAGLGGPRQNSELTVGCSNTQNGLACRGNVDGSYAISFFIDTTNVGSIRLLSTGADYATTSDIRLKHDDRPVMQARALLDRLPVYDFAWTMADVRSLGVMAQEVRDVLPNAVLEGRGEPGEPEFQPWGVDYSKYVPLLIAAVQDAFREIDALKKIIEGRQ